MNVDRTAARVVVVLALVLAWLSPALAGPDLLERAYASIQRRDIQQAAPQLKAAYLELLVDACRKAQQRLATPPEESARICTCHLERATTGLSDAQWVREATEFVDGKPFNPMPTLEQLARKAADCAPHAVARSLNVEGSNAIRRGDFAAATAAFEKAHRLLLTERGIDHPETLYTATMLGIALIPVGRSAEADQILTPLLNVQRKRLGGRHADVLSLQMVIAAAKLGIGKPEEALPLAEASMRLSSEVLGPQHQGTYQSALVLSSIYLAQGRTSDALPLQQQVLRIAEARRDEPGTLQATRALAESLFTLGRDAEALPLFERLVQSEMTGTAPLTATAAADAQKLAGLYEARDRGADAQRLRDKIYKRRTRMGQ